jgi:hypothetical protein
MALQLAPAESHRSHWYAYFKFFPDQAPVLAVSVFGSTAVPLIDGDVVSSGACCPGGPEPPEAPPVARMRVTTATVAAVMRRLTTSLPSGGARSPATLKRGRPSEDLQCFRWN